MSSPLILPCSAVRVGQKVSHPDSLVASLQVQGAMATMTLTGVGFPQVMLRLERDAYACKMSHPDTKGHHIVMLLDVNLVRPMQLHVSNFLGKTEEGRAFFQQLYLLFDQDSNYWSRQQYEAFVLSVKANFPGDSWGFMGAEESANAWSENKTPGEATQKPLLTPIEMDSNELQRLEDGQWISGDIVNFALQDAYSHLKPGATGIWLANTYFLPILKSDGSEKVMSWLPESAVKCKYWIIPGFSHEFKHWFTLIVANPSYCFSTDRPNGNGECTIIILDSHFVNRVHSKDETAIQGLLKDLGIEQGFKHFKNPKVIQPKVPKQSNGNDCGVYAIHFARLWLLEADRLMHVVLNAPRSQKDIDRAWKCWRIPGLRQKLHEEVLTSAERGWFKQQKETHMSGAI